MRKKAYDYDLIVIGAGIAGMVFAMTANGLGKQVAVVEKWKVGGNCTNSTCIPSKALIRLSHLSRDMARLGRFGLRALPGDGLASKMVMAHIRKIVQMAYEKDLPETFERIGIHVISASAAFVDAQNHILPRSFAQGGSLFLRPDAAPTFAYCGPGSLRKLP
jgi:pyruvate/2-oxoglutarate dehydrogenase complex dihydrolipoamide dehydrogenase (E3) component